VLLQNALSVLKASSDKHVAQRDGKEPRERKEFSWDTKQETLLPSASLEVWQCVCVYVCTYVCMCVCVCVCVYDVLLFCVHGTSMQ